MTNPTLHDAIDTLQKRVEDPAYFGVVSIRIERGRVVSIKEDRTLAVYKHNRGDNPNGNHTRNSTSKS